MMSNVGGTMVGAGQAHYHGQRMPASQALALAGLQPLAPFAADDAALTSTNAYSAGQAALLVHDAKRLLDWSDLTFSMSMLGLNSSVTPLTAVPQNARPFPYQNWQAKRLLDLIRGSYLFDLEPDGKRIIQDPLSFRDYNQRNGAAWQEWAQLKKNMLIQINSSDHNPAVVPGSKPSDSWELNTPWLEQYYVNSGGKKGFILSNSNFVAMPWANDMEAFTIALAQSIAGSVQRDLRFPDTFFTVIAPSDVFSPDVLAKAAPQAASYTISDLMAEVQQLANPIPAQGNALVRNVEDMENFTRQKVARARLAVDNAFRLVAQEALSAAYWMNVRSAQKPSRSFAVAPDAAWKALRAVIPWQADSRPEVPAGELAYAFMVANPASTFALRLVRRDGIGGENPGSRPYNPGVAVEIDPPDLYRLSLAEYHRLIESGGFDEDARVELIDGLLVGMSPRTAAHDNVIEWLACRLQLAVDPERLRVRSCLALTIGTSEPEPDIAVVELHTPRPYHPSTAALVVEVSASSLERDLRQKAILYARAAIPLYWVIDIDHRRAVVHSKPGPDGYGHVEVVGADGELTAGEVGVPSIPLAAVLAAGRP